MTQLLVKKQLMEIFRMYFYDAKHNKRRSATSTILLFGMFIAIMVVLLGGVFAYVARSLCGTLVALDLSWMYFCMMGLIAIVLGVFGCVFNTFSGLYLAKDNDLLISMPIPVGTIIFSRLITTYLMGLMYSAVVAVPAVIVYFTNAGFSVMALVGGIFFVFNISLIVLVLSCALGWAVAKLSLKLKNKSFMRVLISLVFIGGYYFVYFKATSLLSTFLANAFIYGEAVKGYAYPLYFFGRAAEGAVLPLIVVTAVVGALSFITWRVLERSFLGIVTSSGNTTRVKYKEKAAKENSALGALIGKEFTKLFSNSNYMLNCALSVLFIPAGGVFFLIKGHSIIQVLSGVFGPESIGVFAVAAGCFFVSMNDMATPSMSLEGKSLWILKSLPVSPKMVLQAKLMPQIILSIVPMLFFSLCAVIVVKPSAVMGAMIFIVPAVFSVMMACIDLLLGVIFANFKWSNEITPIKQSLAVMIAIFGTWILAAALIGGYLLLGSNLGGTAYLLVATAVLALIAGAAYRWLMTGGVKKFIEY